MGVGRPGHCRRHHRSRDRPIKADTRGRRNGDKIAVNRHHDAAPCEGRRHLAVATFARLGAIAGSRRGSHRIVSVKFTQEAERRGLVLALSASIEVTLMGDNWIRTSDLADVNRAL